MLFYSLRPPLDANFTVDTQLEPDVTLDIDSESLRGLRRSFARKCLDWTERHHHIGGSVGAALLSRFMEMKRLGRVRQTRAVRMTHDGEPGFDRVFGIRCGTLRS
jgi:hypothetical protein